MREVYDDELEEAIAACGEVRDGCAWGERVLGYEVSAGTVSAICRGLDDTEHG